MDGCWFKSFNSSDDINIRPSPLPSIVFDVCATVLTLCLLLEELYEHYKHSGPITAPSVAAATKATNRRYHISSELFTFLRSFLFTQPTLWLSQITCIVAPKCRKLALPFLSALSHSFRVGKAHLWKKSVYKCRRDDTWNSWMCF